MFIFLSSEERQQKRVSEQLEDVEQDTANVIPRKGGEGESQGEGERAEEIKRSEEGVELGGKGWGSDQHHMVASPLPCNDHTPSPLPTHTHSWDSQLLSSLHLSAHFSKVSVQVTTVGLSGCYIDSAPDPHTERVREKGVRVWGCEGVIVSQAGCVTH